MLKMFSENIFLLFSDMLIIIKIVREISGVKTV